MTKKETTGKRISFLNMLVYSDIVHAFKKLLTEHGYMIDPDTHLITPKFAAIDITTPWVHVCQDKERVCAMYMNTFQAALMAGKPFVPRRCMTCWKLVVRPSTIVQLFRLQAMMEEHCLPRNYFCKLGIEERKYVHGNYGGYFYCNSQEEGRQRWRFVRKLLDEHVGTDGPDLVYPVTLILKRGCTEFEMELGDSTKWDEIRDPNTDAIEDGIMEAFDFSAFKKMGQPDYLKRHVQRRWLERAWDIADPTAVFFNDNKPFFEPLVVYSNDLQEEYNANKRRDKEKVSE